MPPQQGEDPMADEVGGRIEPAATDLVHLQDARRSEDGPERHTTWWGSPSASSGALVPTPLVELVVVDAEVVGELVHDGDGDLVGEFVFVVAHRAQRQSVDGDPVGK